MAEDEKKMGSIKRSIDRDSTQGKKAAGAETEAKRTGVQRDTPEEMRDEMKARLEARRAEIASRNTTKHVVAEGETLSHLSLKYYKTANRWEEIYEANKEVIGDDPGMIKVGQELVIPNPEG